MQICDFRTVSMALSLQNTCWLGSFPLKKTPMSRLLNLPDPSYVDQSCLSIVVNKVWLVLD
jgi:hypothetical protein